MIISYRFVIAFAVYTLAFILLHPLYQFRFDADGVGYLSVTKLLAGGNFCESVNGYWSPLHSWLMVPFYKMGINEFTAFLVSNGVFGAFILFFTHRLLNKTPVDKSLRTMALLMAVPMILAFVFHDLAADVPMCLLLLIYLDITTGKNFFDSTKKNLLCAFIAALSYFAKTYAMPFFLIHFMILQLVLYRQSKAPGKKLVLARNLALFPLLFFTLTVPWMYVLSEKYGYNTFGYSGRLNFFWTLIPRKQPDHLLSAPPAPLTSHWVDPWYFFMDSQYQPYQFSFSLVVKEVRVFLENVITILRSFHGISFFSNVIILTLFLYVVKKREPLLALFLLMIALLPAGYMLVHVETRFFWAPAIIILITGVIFLEKAMHHFNFKGNLRFICECIFFVSFLIYPINFLKDNAGKGKEVFQLASELKQKGITAKSLVTTDPSFELGRIAYLTDNRAYSLTRTKYTYEELGKAMKENDIDYFFFYYNNPSELEVFRLTDLYKGSVEEIKTSRSNLLLLKMR